MRRLLAVVFGLTLATGSAAQTSIDHLRAELGTVRLVTGTDYTPFVDNALPDGGVLTALVTAAFRAVGVPVTLDVTSWSDGAAAVRTGQYDATFPYFATRLRRSAMLFSEPLFNVDQSLFQRPPGSIAYRRVDDLIGHSLCHPGGYALPVAVQRLVDSDQIRLSLAPSPQDCLRRVAVGAMTGVILPRLQVLTLLQAEGLDLVEAHEPVERRSLHVVGTMANPRGALALDAFEQGRAVLQQRNEWDRIIVRHLGLAVLNWNRLRLADREED